MQHVIDLIANVNESVVGKEGWPQWLRAFQAAGLFDIQKLGFPSTQDEAWKYTNIQALLKQRYHLPTVSVLPDHSQLDAWRMPGAIELVFVNGIWSEQLSSMNLSKGVRITRASDASAKAHAALMAASRPTSAEDAFGALNRGLFAEGIVIEVDAQVQLSPLIHCLYVSAPSTQAVLALPRLWLLMGAQSQASLLESYVGATTHSYFTNAVTEAVLQPGANLQHCKIQAESVSAYHVGSSRFCLERDSQLSTFSLSTGALLGRNQLDIQLLGEGAGVVLNGLYAAHGEQVLDNHTSVQHAVPRCSSRQLYKGILTGKSRAVFNGRVHVPQYAQQTDGYQLNKNLLLSPDARVYTKPELEIYADDVKCTHGATVGQLDPDWLFYLRSRGISKREATSMLIHGFIDDVILTMTHDDVRARMHQIVQKFYEHEAVLA